MHESNAFNFLPPQFSSGVDLSAGTAAIQVPRRELPGLTFDMTKEDLVDSGDLRKDHGVLIVGVHVGRTVSKNFATFLSLFYAELPSSEPSASLQNPKLLWDGRKGKRRIRHRDRRLAASQVSMKLIKNAGFFQKKNISLLLRSLFTALLGTTAVGGKVAVRTSSARWVPELNEDNPIAFTEGFRGAAGSDGDGEDEDEDEAV